MANIKQILKASQMSYTALNDLKAVQGDIDNYQFVDYQFDNESHHGGIAYYNPSDQSVLIAHRGSVTKTDWLKNNPQIFLEKFGKPRETMADVAAKRFTVNVLEKLDRENNVINQVLLGSHSKGGRESQASLIEVVDNLKLDALALTFNSAPFKNPTGREYNHLNLQLSGGSIFNTDIVSVLGEQLGGNYKIISDKINNPIAAHSLKNFEHIMDEYKELVSDDIGKTFFYLKENNKAGDYALHNIQKAEEYKSVSMFIPERSQKLNEPAKSSFDINELIKQEKIIDDTRYKGNQVFEAVEAMYAEKEKLVEKFISAVEGQGESGLRGISVQKGNETILLSPSAKEDGKWQVTYLDAKMIPIMDAGNQKLEDAANSFLESFRFSELDVAQADKILEFSGVGKMDEKTKFLGENIDELKLVRVVKDIDNYQIEGNTLIINKNHESESIRNTTHFTLNAVVNDHVYGAFSESKYAIIADLQDTAQNNKIHGISPADTYFWNGEDGVKLNSPVIVIPENDNNFERLSDSFKVIEYKEATDIKENFNNLKKAVEVYFSQEKLPFYQVGMWSWSNGSHNSITDQDKNDISKTLGQDHLLQSVHIGSIDEQMESISAAQKVLEQYLKEINTAEDIKTLSFSFGHEIEQLERSTKALIEQATNIQPHSVEYYSDNVVNKIEELKEKWDDKRIALFPENEQQSSSGISAPPPLPVEFMNERNALVDSDWRNTNVGMPQVSNVEYQKESISPNLADKLNAISNLNDDFVGDKERRFFIDPENAVQFSKENFKDIQQLLELHAKHTGYETTNEYIKESPYFKDFKDEELDKALQNKDDWELNKIYEVMAVYAADSLVYDYDYFKDMQQNIQENYATGEMYIFLSDDNSQSIFIKDNTFMDDEKSQMGAELDAKVFDKVEQVEDYLEANESMLQARINKINLVDMRGNSNIAVIKSLAQGKLNHIREEMSELKTFDSAHVMPLGEAKNNVIMIDANGHNLFSVSKGKLVGHDIGIDDIIKNHSKVELFNNGNDVQVKISNANEHEKLKTETKNKDAGMELDI